MSGEIINREDQTIEITKAADPNEDILIMVYGGSSPAVIDVCNGAGRYIMDSGGMLVVTCDSVKTRVTRGVVTAKFTAIDGTVAEAYIPVGNILEFYPDTTVFNSPETNPDPITLEIDDEPQCAYDDWNEDGYTDLVCQFVDNTETWLPGKGEATLLGRRSDNGLPINGTDNICIVP